MMIYKFLAIFDWGDSDLKICTDIRVINMNLGFHMGIPMGIRGVPEEMSLDRN